MPYGASRTAERDMRLAVSGKFTRFTKYELKKKIKTNQMKINTLYDK